MRLFLHKTLFFFSCLLLFDFKSIIAGNRTIDSLETVVKSAGNDSNKVNALNALSSAWMNAGKYPNAKNCADEALSLSNRIQFKTGIANAYKNLGFYYSYYEGNHRLSYENHKKSMTAFNEAGSRTWVAACLLHIGTVFSEQGQYGLSRKFDTKAYNIWKKLNDKKGMSMCLTNIGAIYIEEGNYNKALEYFLDALKITEELGDKKQVSVILTNIGIVNYYRHDIDKALEYSLKSLQFKIELNDKYNMASSMVNIGSFYLEKGDSQKAIEYTTKGIGICEEIGNNQILVHALNTLAVIHRQKGDLGKALDYHNKSLALKENLGDKYGIAATKINLAILYMKQFEKNMDKNMLLKALENAKESLSISQKIKSTEREKEAENTLNSIYEKLASFSDSPIEKTGYYAKSFEHFKNYISMRDSIFNKENIKRMVRLESKYEYDKKETVMKAGQEKYLAVAAAESRKQKIVILFVFCCLLFVGLTAYLIFRNYSKTKKANIIIAAQKKEIEMQKQDITDSIEYAGNIQHSMLPSPDELNALLHEHFIFYKPKAIVSGDFYWISPSPALPYGKGEKSPYLPADPIPKSLPDITASKVLPTGEDIGGAVLFCTADCTGHGVPGAFMSMLCTALLNEAVNDKGITSPEKIFEEVRRGIIVALKQKGKMGEAKDGMDASIISIEYGNAERPDSPDSYRGDASSLRTQMATSLHATCANNSVYIVRPNPSPHLGGAGGCLTELKPDRFPVGVYEGELNPFALHSAPLQKGDMIYTMTDGFEDQMGSPPHSPPLASPEAATRRRRRGDGNAPFYGKKFKSKRLKELLVSIAPEPVEKQKNILEKTFLEWKGDGEQTDDVTIIGIRI